MTITPTAPVRARRPRPKKGEGQWALGHREPLNKNEQTKKDVDITHDIDAASGGAGSGVPATPDMQGFQTREDYNDILGTCMAELGYSRVK